MPSPDPETSQQVTRLVDDRGLVSFEPKTEDVGQGGRLGFLNLDAWRDGDGTHVWLAHDCLGERVVTMLPWPTWQADNDGYVEPSFACDRCMTHGSARINRWLHRRSRCRECGYVEAAVMTASQKSCHHEWVADV